MSSWYSWRSSPEWGPAKRARSRHISGPSRTAERIAAELALARTLSDVPPTTPAMQHHPGGRTCWASGSRAEKRKEGRPQKRAHSEPVSEKQPIRTAERMAGELDIGMNTFKRAGRYARAVDTLVADSPTIKRKILSGEINQPRAAIVEIAAQPVAERAKAGERMERGDPPEPAIVTKVCRSCGHELPLETFSVRGSGCAPTCCRCAAQWPRPPTAG